MKSELIEEIKKLIKPNLIIKNDYINGYNDAINKIIEIIKEFDL